jgi:hypothetical protein
MNDGGPVERNSSEIKRDLRRRRSELEENLKRLFGGRNPGPDGSDPARGPSEPLGVIRNGAGAPVLSIAAGAALIGAFFLLRRRLWPLHLAGRFVELAAPVAVPLLVRRIIAGRVD